MGVQRRSWAVRVGAGPRLETAGACYWNMQRGRVCMSEWFKRGTDWRLHSRQRACLAHKLTVQTGYVAPAELLTLSDRFC